jgi:GntR family transcriptional regulator
MPKSQLHVQARDQILAITRQRKLQAGDRLPSETELSQAIGVSRNTIRDALMILERHGVIVRQHGIGTFLTPSPQHLKTGLHQMLPIPELIAASGFTPRIKNLKITETRSPSLAHQILNISSNEPVSTISLLYLADKRPAIYVTYWLIPSLNSNELNWNKFDGHMVNFVEQFTPVRIHHTVARIYAVTATKELADTLKVKCASPLLKMTHTAFSANGQSIYCSVSFQDSDLLEVTVVRQRK